MAAIALVLVFEGLLLCAAPASWKRAARQMLALADGQLRGVGLAVMVSGAVLLMIAR